MMMITVTYDITSNRRRSRVFKILKDYGVWKQYSVFECILRRKEDIERMRQRILLVIDPAEDTVRFYQLCDNCVKDVMVIGNGEKVEKPRLPDNQQYLFVV